MPTLTLSKTYDTGQILDAVDLDNWLTDLETLLNETKLNDANIQNAGITGSSKLTDNSISSDRLANNAVTTAKIADSGISDSTVINASAVTTDKLAADSVTTAKIADSNITTALIPDNTLTKVKLAAVNGIAYDETSYDQTTTTEITGASINLTTTGRPVHLLITPESTTTFTNAVAGFASYATVGVSNLVADTTIQAKLRLYRDSTLISEALLGMTRVVSYAGSGYGQVGFAISYLDATPAAATYTYSFKILSTDSDATIDVRFYKLSAREI